MEDNIKEYCKRVIEIARIFNMQIAEDRSRGVDFICTIQDIKSVVDDEKFNNDMKIGAILRILFPYEEDFGFSSSEQMNRLSRELEEIKAKVN